VIVDVSEVRSARCTGSRVSRQGGLQLVLKTARRSDRGDCAYGAAGPEGADTPLRSPFAVGAVRHDSRLGSRRTPASAASRLPSGAVRCGAGSVGQVLDMGWIRTAERGGGSRLVVRGGPGTASGLGTSPRVRRRYVMPGRGRRSRTSTQCPFGSRKRLQQASRRVIWRACGPPDRRSR